MIFTRKDILQHVDKVLAAKMTASLNNSQVDIGVRIGFTTVDRYGVIYQQRSLYRKYNSKLAIAYYSDLERRSGNTKRFNKSRDTYISIINKIVEKSTQPIKG